MPVSTSALNAAGQVYEHQVMLAWSQLEKKEFAKANELAQWLVSQPDIGDLHKAVAHVILAHSPDERVYHALEALKLYKGLTCDTQEEKGNRAERVLSTTRLLEKIIKKQAEAGETPELGQDELQLLIDEAAVYTEDADETLEKKSQESLEKESDEEDEDPSKEKGEERVGSEKPISEIDIDDLEEDTQAKPLPKFLPFPPWMSMNKPSE